MAASDACVFLRRPLELLELHSNTAQKPTVLQAETLTLANLRQSGLCGHTTLANPLHLATCSSIIFPPSEGLFAFAFLFLFYY